jgi:nucleoid-associated protein YgaU
MTPSDRPRHGPGLLAKLVGVLAFEVLAVVLLHWAGHYQFLQVPFGDLDRWLSDAPAEDVLAATIRLLGLVLAYWLLASTIIYTIGLLAGRPGLLRSTSWAMVPGARRVLDGLLAVSLTGGSLTAALPAASASTPASVTEPAEHPLTALAAAPEDIASKAAIYPQSTPLPPPPGDARTHQIQGGESLLDIAEQHLGDHARWRDIWAVNAERLQAAGLTPDTRPQIGWTLVLPNPQPTAEPPPPASGAEPYTVEPGDNLWDISETHLTDHLQRPPDDAEIAPYWHETIDANRDTITSGDPDLIYPGESLTLPALPGTPAAAPQPAPPNGDSTPHTTPPAPPSPDEAPPAPAPTTSTTNTTNPTTTATTDTPATTTPGTTLPPTTAGAPTTTPSTDQPRGTDDSDSPLSQPGAIAAAGVTTALAGLTLHALARRRRARRRTARPGTETPARPDEDLATELALANLSNGALDRAWQAAQQLRIAVPDAELPTVTGMVVSPTGDVTLHLRNPGPPAPPFAESPTVPGGWHLPADTELPQSEEAAVPLLETVVAVGRTSDESWVFLDLESLGAITLDGDPTQAARLARSIAAELALQPADHYVDITVAGGLEPPSGTEHAGVQVIDRLDETLVRQLHHGANETATYLSTEGINTTCTGRARGLPRDGLIVMAVLVNQGADPVLLDRLADAAMPGGRGLAVVALDPLNEPATQLVVDHDGTLHLPHLGLTASAAGLDVDELRQLDGLLEREPEAVTPAPPRAADETPPALPTVPNWVYQVRLFADHRVERADGSSVSFRYGEPGVPNRNTTRGAELLSYLALRPDRSASLDEIRDHLWWGKPISSRTADTLVSGTRQLLGGGDYISHAEGEPGHRRYRLQPIVVTDLDLLEHDLAHAQAIAEDKPHEAAELLRQRLATIERPAFNEQSAGAGIADWADAKRITGAVQQPVIEAGLFAADLYVSQGPTGRPQARWVVDQALNACPDNEALTRTAMQLDALSGHLDAAHSRYVALAQRLARDELEPEPETTDVHREIVSPST